MGRDGKPATVRPQHEPPPEVRITVDNRCQNKAIRRTHYPSKTLEELLYEVNGAQIFSNLDIIKAFHIKYGEYVGWVNTSERTKQRLS